MRTVTIKPTEFPNFQELAKQMHMQFTYEVKKGQVNITAPATDLETLGY